MKKPSKLQNSVVEQIEKIGHTIGMIEGICHDLEKLEPVLVNDMGELYHTQRIIKFIIDHRKYTLWFNQMRDFLFQELLDGAIIAKLE